MSSVRLYTRDEVLRENDGTNKVLFVINNNVYDVTSYLEEHPGGSDVLLEQGGKDATAEFDLVGHSLDARELMQQYKVGELILEDRSGHNQSRWNIMYNLWTYLIPLGVAIIGSVGYKLYKRI